MKRYKICGMLALLGFLATVASAQTPLLYYSFSETGTAAQSGGLITSPLTLTNTSGSAADLHSAGGLGVSGLPEDMAFDNTASTGMGNAGVGGVALLPAYTIGTLSSFTFVTWVKVAKEVNGYARLLDDDSISAECDGGNIQFFVNSTSGYVTSAYGYTQTDQWMFIAITYDSTIPTNNVVFYVGSQTAAVAQVGSAMTYSQGPVSQGNNALGIGNDRDVTNARPLDGYMDDVRLFGSATDNTGALTHAQLERLRELDLAYQSLPAVPIVSGSLSATGTGNFPFTYQIVTSSTATSFGATGLPTGLSVSAATGLISGTPTETGTFLAVVSAGNITGTDSAGMLTLAVVPPPVPVISSTLSATATNGLAFGYQIQGTNNPASFAASGLPTGLGVDASTGVISGTPTQSGTFGATISAINLGGTGSNTLSLVVITPPGPVISSTLSAGGTDGDAFAYQITVISPPAGFGASGLPAGLSVNASTGLISGIPTQSGTYDADISAIDAGGTDSEILVLTIQPSPPVITSPLAAAGVNGTAFNYQIVGTNNPVTYGATGLPPGLAVSPSTGAISGTPSAGGVFPAAISAGNGGGTTSAPLVLTVTTSLPGLKGSYTGLGAVGGINQALITLSVTAKGTFTGKFTAAGVKEKLKGTFTQYGTFIGGAVGASPGSQTVALSANAAAPGISGTITAIIASEATNYIVQSSLLGTFKPATLPPGLAGAYTAVLPALSGTDPTLPHAPGYGTMTVSTKGAVHIAGKLGDGTPFTAAAQLDADGKTWTLFDLLSAKKTLGTIAGTMTFESLPDSDADGAINWIKPPQATGAYYPGGFAASTNLLAAKYATAPFTTGTGIAIGGGDLPPNDVTDSLTISSKDKVTVTGADAGVKLTLTLATGAFTGTFLDPANNNTKTPFGGVIYEKPSAAGSGLFLGTDQSGGVDITP